ncbi:MAG: LLM class flavin-dependent oxidoreductase, partial [Acidimicrobiaceae bacterium]|nr:LLM class flavin-dependent oxidoreductase [Acidimicrobiaceae bacterium]
REALHRGLARRHGGIRPEPEAFGSLSVEITDDVQGALDARKPLVAMYVGGMGSDTHNFHAEAMARRGWPEASALIVELWRAGRRDEAVAAVPDDYVDSQSLVGPTGRIRARWPQAIPAGLTGAIIRCRHAEGLRLAAELAGTRDITGANP